MQLRGQDIDNLIKTVFNYVNKDPRPDQQGVHYLTFKALQNKREAYNNIRSMAEAVKKDKIDNCLTECLTQNRGHCQMIMIIVIIHVADLRNQNQAVLSCTIENKEFSSKHRLAHVLICSHNMSSTCFKINF